MRLTTVRLQIGPLTESDAVAFVAYRNDPEVARYQSWDPGYTNADALALIRGQAGLEFPEEGKWLQLGIRAADDGRLVGDVGVHRIASQPATFELGVSLASCEQGKGFATEAVAAVVGSLFEIQQAHRMIASCDARNTAVQRLLERVGFRRESRLVEGDWFKGEWTTLDGFAILAREWPRT